MSPYTSSRHRSMYQQVLAHDYIAHNAVVVVEIGALCGGVDRGHMR